MGHPQEGTGANLLVSTAGRPEATEKLGTVGASRCSERLPGPRGGSKNPATATQGSENTGPGNIRQHSLCLWNPVRNNVGL